MDGRLDDERPLFLAEDAPATLTADDEIDDERGDERIAPRRLSDMPDGPRGVDGRVEDPDERALDRERLGELTELDRALPPALLLPMLLLLPLALFGDPPPRDEGAPPRDPRATREQHTITDRPIRAHKCRLCIFTGFPFV